MDVSQLVSFVSILYLAEQRLSFVILALFILSSGLLAGLIVFSDNEWTKKKDESAKLQGIGLLYTKHEGSCVRPCSQSQRVLQPWFRKALRYTLNLNPAEVNILHVHSVCDCYLAKWFFQCIWRRYLGRNRVASAETLPVVAVSDQQHQHRMHLRAAHVVS